MMSEYQERQDGFDAGQRGERPECLVDAHLDFLDRIRESGVRNMYQTIPNIREAFPQLSECEIGGVLGYWMRTFGDRQLANRSKRTAS